MTVVAIAFLLRLETAAAPYRTADEQAWMDRSTTFSDSLLAGDVGSASAAGRAGSLVTMPGVATMWVGTAARAIWTVADGGGPDSVAFNRDPAGLNLAQGLIAAVTALLVGLLAYLMSCWVAPSAAAITGVILATEPFFVAHGAVLHTDEMLALLGTCALVAASLALGVPTRTHLADRPWVAYASGALLGGAIVTKLTASTFAASLVLLGAVACWSVRQSGGERSLRVAARPVARTAVRSIVGGVVVVIALYPALWSRPITELGLLRSSAQLGSTGHVQFFLGDVTATPGLGFYLVALPLRASPWFLVAAVLSTVAACLLRDARRTMVVLGLMTLPTLVVLSLSSKQFDRYGLPVLTMAAILVGVMGSRALRSLTERWGSPVLLSGAALCTGLVCVHSLAVAPWGLAYFNPALGGSSVAERAVLIGWGEGLERAGAIIEEREQGRCDSVTISAYNMSSAFPCGEIVDVAADPTYVVLYVSQRQRATPAQLTSMTEGRERVDAVEIRGIVYAEVFGPRHATRPAPRSVG